MMRIKQRNSGFFGAIENGMANSFSVMSRRAVVVSIYIRDHCRCIFFSLFFYFPPVSISKNNVSGPRRIVFCGSRRNLDLSQRLYVNDTFYREKPVRPEF